jgi:hypothetical protein
VTVLVRWPGVTGDERFTIAPTDRFITIEQGKGQRAR